VNGFGFPGNVLQRALPDFAHVCIDMATIKRRRDRLVPVLAEHGYEPTNPQGTFYVMARSPKLDDEAYVAGLAAEDFFVLPGTTVKMPGWFRISLTASDAMVEAAAERFARVPIGA
jgi:aspartate aminotransferase